MTMQSSGYAPRRGVFEATLKCNLRCKHCGSRAGVAREDELTIDEIRTMFADLKKLGMEWITISGGEPMCREDWPEVIEAATSVGIRTGMITNAVTLDASAARLAKKKGLSGIGLSLDGGVAQTHDFVRGRIGHFRQLTSAMDTCREVGMPFAVLSHLNTRNISELEDMHQLIVDKGAYAWQVQLGTDMGNMSDHRDMLLSSGQLIGVEKRLAAMIRKSPIRIHPSDSVGYFGPNEKWLRKASKGTHFAGCGAGKTVIGIESNGNIKGCLSIMAGYNERGQEFVEGNIRHTPLAEIWHREGAFAYTRNWTIDELGGFCKTCDKAAVCKGGCTAKKVASGDGVENPMCVYRALHEQKESGQYVSKQAAAVALAMLLGAGVNACDSTDGPVVGDTETTSEDDDDTSDTATADTDVIDTSDDSETAMMEYGMPVDSETMAPDYGFPEDTETDAVPDYGFPEDTETDAVPDYGFPEDTETAMMEYGMPLDTETFYDADYGMPVETDVPAYGMPLDTETAMMEYGMPFDTELMMDYGVPLPDKKSDK